MLLLFDTFHGAQKIDLCIFPRSVDENAIGPTKFVLFLNEVPISVWCRIWVIMSSCLNIYSMIGLEFCSEALFPMLVKFGKIQMSAQCVVRSLQTQLPKITKLRSRCCWKLLVAQGFSSAVLNARASGSLRIVASKKNEWWI
jgi:hypothetical protein